MLLDNPSQSYINFGDGSYGQNPMADRLYFGALYGELDYYLMAGDDVADVLAQYNRLVGPAALAPKWALGYHQGCYGYYDQAKVLETVASYREARIPLDGVHIDVDFQDNYRTFTASPAKFPDGGRQVFAQLAERGIKASTNITAVVPSQPLDEEGRPSSYSVLDEGLARDAFIVDERAEGPGPAYPGSFVANENYGINYGSNPYPSPGAPQHSGPGSALGTYGHYPDLGRDEVRRWWGDQIRPLLEAGLEMIWLDMTDPATTASVCDSAPWKTLPLNLLVHDRRTDSPVPAAVIHNAYAQHMLGAIHDAVERHRDDHGVDKRTFIVARGGYAGVQRFAASWTGDSASD